MVSRTLRFRNDLPVVYGFLQPSHFFNDPYEAQAEGGEAVFHLDWRLFTENRTLQDAEADHLAQALVQHFR
jgi:hypothetical protein